MAEPDDPSDEIEPLEERKAHFEKVKSSYLAAHAALPYVQYIIDLTDWQIRMRKNLPPESADIPRINRTNEIKTETVYLKGLYPEIKVPTNQELLSSTSTTTVSGTLDYTFASRVFDIGTPAAIRFGSSFVGEYTQLQDVQKRPQQVRALLEKLNTRNLVERFDTAQQSYLAFRSGSAKRTAAANELRNLLHGFKGELFNRARRFPKENMSWNSMAARLAVNGGTGTEHVVLSAQHVLHSSLLSRLADVLKDREGGSITNLDNIWTETLDHLYSVLGLIK